MARWRPQDGLDVLGGSRPRRWWPARSCCARCGRSHRHKDTRTITVRTLFGTLLLDSPRFLACRCRADDAQGSVTFSPLAALLALRSTPELVYLQARFAAVMS
jgi:hypothetical protein